MIYFVKKCTYTRHFLPHLLLKLLHLCMNMQKQLLNIIGDTGTKLKVNISVPILSKSWACDVFLPRNLLSTPQNCSLNILIPLYHITFHSLYFRSSFQNTVLPPTSSFRSPAKITHDWRFAFPAHFLAYWPWLETIIQAFTWINRQ